MKKLLLAACLQIMYSAFLNQSLIAATRLVNAATYLSSINESVMMEDENDGDAIDAGVQVLLNCSPPAGVNIESVSSCTVTLNWSPVDGVSNYRIKYRKNNTNSWSIISVDSATTYTVTGLDASTNYQFCVSSVCGTGSRSAWTAAVSDKTKSCSTPLSPAVQSITSTTAMITWQQTCYSVGFRLRYRPSGTTTWTTMENISNTQYLLSGLSPHSGYEFCVSSMCQNGNSVWSSKISFTTTPDAPAARPNILMIMTDDDRYDSYTVNGGPDWFVTPSITRIADEGVNFKIMIPSTSQCAPSRSSIYTGKYAHDNKCHINGENYDHSLFQIQKIIGDNGYYTGFVGKYGQNLGDPDGFDWWGAIHSVYKNPDYTINGVKFNGSEHISDVERELTLQFLNTVPSDTPFLLFYFTYIPHNNAWPKDEDTVLFKNELVPEPDNVVQFADDYPSFYYPAGHGMDTSGNDALRLRRFQCLAEHERNTDTIIHWLEEHGMLDNTLLIYTADNGFMTGEHYMEGKRYFLEEACRVPLFIRYPAWFSAGQVVTDQITSTIDFAPTFLEAAGIQNTFGFYGTSLKKLADHEVSRRKFLYEFGPDDQNPSIRGIRTLTGKYIFGNCTSVTEEFYDLVADPKESANRIFIAGYQDTITLYRHWLDSLRVAFGDTVEPAPFDCELINQDEAKMNVDETEPEEFPSPFISVYPNPSDGPVTVSYGLPFGITGDEVCIYDVKGNRIKTFQTKNSAGQFTLSGQQLSPGIYAVVLQGDGKVLAQTRFAIGK